MCLPDLRVFLMNLSRGDLSLGLRVHKLCPTAEVYECVGLLDRGVFTPPWDVDGSSLWNVG